MYVGDEVGISDGLPVGDCVLVVGLALGDLDGAVVGFWEGACVGEKVTPSQTKQFTHDSASA